MFSTFEMRSFGNHAFSDAEIESLGNPARVAHQVDDVCIVELEKRGRNFELWNRNSGLFSLLLPRGNSGVQLTNGPRNYPHLYDQIKSLNFNDKNVNN